jgi:PAS domain S-box-containing protein
MSGQRKTILLVEDEAIIAMSETRKLKDVGYSVVLARSGEEAVDLFHVDPSSIDLILMDIDLGAGIDGTDAAREILKMHDVPVLFLSSHTEHEIVERTERITNYGYVVKSSVFTVLEASIKMAFKLFEAQKKLCQKNMEIEAVNERLRITIEDLQVTSEELETANRNLVESEQEVTLQSRKLAASESRLTRAESVAGIGNWEYQLGTDLIATSKGAEKIYGFPTDSCRLSDIQGIPLPEYRPAMDDALRRLIEDGATYDLYFKIRQIGTDAILDIHSIAKYDKDDRIVFGIIQDVTSMKRTEETTRLESLFLRTLIDNLPDPIYFNDAEGRKIIANRADIENIRRGFEGDPLGKTDLQLFPGEAGARGHRDNLAVIENGEPIINREEEFFEADGDRRWLLTSKIPLRDSQGAVIGLVGIGRDITERKTSEDKIAQERIFLQTLIDILPDIVYFKDSSGRTIISNSASVKHIERNPENEGLDKTDLEMFPGRIGIRGYSDDQRVLKEGTSITNREEDFVDPEGRVNWLSTSKFPLRNAQGEIIGLVGIGHDITEQKRIERSLRMSADQASVLMKELEHRVKNNLGVVSSLLNLELDALRDEEDKAVFRAAIGRIDSISSVYERLYLSADLATVDVRAYVEYLVDAIFRTTAISGEYLRVTTKLIDLQLDAAHAVPVGLILNEMMTNALKYAYPPRTKGEIHVSLEESGGIVSLCVADDGVGLPGAIDAKTSTSTGMMIMAMLAEQLRGELRIESANGTKASISFRA